MVHFASLQFHPVGQGLFGTGCICAGHDACFRWFYDCGTSSTRKLLLDAIEHQQHGCSCCPWCDTAGSFDLGVISHFDKDHISGITALLDQKPPLRTLLMPYATLAQRLAIAFGQESDLHSDIVQFCANPVSFAHKRWRAQRVLIVAGGARPREENAEERNVEPNDRVGQESGPIQLVVSSSDRIDQEYDVDGSQNDVASMLPVGSQLTCRRGSDALWEFRPYNDQHLANALSEDFAAGLQSLRIGLLMGDKEALGSAKALYDCTFGNSARARNEISLFLHGKQMGAHSGHFWNRCLTYPRLRAAWLDTVLSILYTGDGFLDTCQRYENMQRTLPVHDLVVLQVPHHGSRHAWHRGLGSKLQPKVSIFSADPKRKKLGHPHREVFSDFRNHGPYIVDKTHRFCLIGRVI